MCGKRRRGTAWWVVEATILATVFVAAAVGAAAQSTKQPDDSKQADQAPQPDNAHRGDASNTPNTPSLLTPLKPVTQESPYVPIKPRQRLRWFITNTIGPAHLAGGLFTSAFGTALDRPKEYGPHWSGFADRYGMRITGIVTGNAMEASVGALWGEDPRYFRVPDENLKARVTNVARLTFLARHEDGSFQLAYARYIAISGNNFLSNEWRVHSEANAQDAILRIGEGFAGRMAANAFEEFWPDIKRRARHRTHRGAE